MKRFGSSLRRTACAVVFASVLGGCAVGPDFIRPAPPDSDRYTRDPGLQPTPPADGQPQHFAPGATVAADWWRLFECPPLDAAVRRAIANNPTLEASEATLRQSQDNMRAGYGVFFPQAQAELGASRQRTAAASQGGTTSSRVFNLVTLSGTISYALDVFGGARRTVEGLRAQVDNQGYLTKAAYLTLSGNVVNTTVARAAYAGEGRAVQQLIELQTQQLRLTEDQVRAGTVGYASVLTLRSSIAANRALLAPLNQAFSQAGHLLAILEGVAPSKAVLPEIELTSLSLPLDLPVSLPSELVNQRPDILSAEAQMHVASAQIGVATAALFPTFSLSGTYGAAGSSPSALLAGGGKFWSVGPAVTTPVFQGTSLWYGRRAAIEAFKESQAVYRQTVLGAFGQVADVLTALGHDAEALQAQADARHAAAEALDLLKANYRAGLVTYLEVLAADVQAHQITISYLQAAALRYQDTVALFVALGGGWWNAESPAGKGGAR